MSPTLPEFTIPTPDTDPVLGPLLTFLHQATARHRALPGLIHDAFCMSFDMVMDQRDRARRGQPPTLEEEQALREAAHRVDMLRAELAGARGHLDTQGRLIRETARRRFDEHLDEAALACEALDEAADVADAEGRPMYDAVAQAMQSIRDQLKPWAGAAGLAEHMIPKHRDRIPQPTPGTTLTPADIVARVAHRRTRHLTTVHGGV